MIGTQEVPDWEPIHNDPLSLNIRTGIFRWTLGNNFEVYLLSGTEQHGSFLFDTFDEALIALNSSSVVMVGDNPTLILK